MKRFFFTSVSIISAFILAFAVINCNNADVTNSEDLTGMDNIGTNPAANELTDLPGVQDGDFPVQKLVGTKWKLVGVVNEVGSLAGLEPEDCEKCYTLIFDSDSLLSGTGYANALLGKYDTDSTTGYISINIWTGTYAGSNFGEPLYVEALNEVYRLSLKDNQLLLYYNGDKNYLLFRSL